MSNWFLQQWQGKRVCQRKDDCANTRKLVGVEGVLDGLGSCFGHVRWWEGNSTRVFSLEDVVWSL